MVGKGVVGVRVDRGVCRARALKLPMAWDVNVMPRTVLETRVLESGRSLGHGAGKGKLPRAAAASVLMGGGRGGGRQAGWGGG